MDVVSALQKEWIHLLTQSQDRVHHCVNQLAAEQIWWRPGAKQNSIGIVLRHMAGNLNQWVVKGVPQIPSTRDRAAEFASPVQESAQELLATIDEVVQSAICVIEALTDKQLLQQRTIQQFELTVLGALMHSVPHFVGHTHQVVQLTRQQLNDAYQFHWVPEDSRGDVPL